MHAHQVIASIGAHALVGDVRVTPLAALPPDAPAADAPDSLITQALRDAGGSLLTLLLKRRLAGKVTEQQIKGRLYVMARKGLIVRTGRSQAACVTLLAAPEVH